MLQSFGSYWLGFQREAVWPGTRSVVASVCGSTRLRCGAVYHASDKEAATVMRCVASLQAEGFVDTAPSDLPSDMDKFVNDVCGKRWALGPLLETLIYKVYLRREGVKVDDILRDNNIALSGVLRTMLQATPVPWSTVYGWLNLDQAIDTVVVQPAPTGGQVVTVVYGNRARGVLPIHARFTYSDGSVDSYDYPAEVWSTNTMHYMRRYNLNGKTLTRIELDPDNRLVDIDRANNTWGTPAAAPRP